MDSQSMVHTATRRWTLSWIALTLALGLHVADEAVNDFLGFWNPLVESLRRSIPVLPLPRFSFSLWLGGLIAVTLVLLAMTSYVRRGARWMRPVSYTMATIMFGNGLLHILGSLYLGQILPGVYSAPLLLVTAGLLFATTWKHQMVSPKADTTGTTPERRTR